MEEENEYIKIFRIAQDILVVKLQDYADVFRKYLANNNTNGEKVNWLELANSGKINLNKDIYNIIDETTWDIVDSLLEPKRISLILGDIGDDVWYEKIDFMGSNLFDIVTQVMEGTIIRDLEEGVNDLIDEVIGQ